MKTTTTDSNRTVYIDFVNFEEADNFAKNNNGKVCLLKRNRGEQVWRYMGRAFEPLTIDESEYGANTEFYCDVEQWKENCEQIIQMLTDAGATADEIDAERVELDKIAELFDGLKEDEVVATFGNTEYAEVVKVRNLMSSYCMDNYCYEIGVVVDDDDNE